ncbi:maleylacetoacetate isomerase [Aquisalinus flavus]|uniref:Maleylacetoacetate isomerase n=1 Tax=Aquisalinus flavus TaxID=1526572 RepID=A0A8J2Y5X2_9PROT|nr:maleylacetoacetate isomerase [Aquisalinus flavus]MBD0427649.1 maleylacetoacetate isomerase [Aquisalinus flavus]UNE49223.1 maleylacetoacetate isomerase [Aquisalinus flavus]GGD02724.1 maleylacetoacetate isomerase [Aquisalinus flavus]
MKLYSYWRSGTSYRTRIALELKGIDYEIETVDLRAGAHNGPAYLEHNRQGLVPTLVLDDGTNICQSPAIIEYLEEYKPEPSLLPVLPEDRATVRAMAAIIGCDTHPLGNLRVLKYLKDEFDQDQAGINKWAGTWMKAAFDSLEKIVVSNDHEGEFCFGETPTIADCYLIPQIYSAARFDVDLSPYPALLKVHAACEKLEAFQRAHPDNQPDAD